MTWLTVYQLVHYHHRQSSKENDSEYSHNLMIITLLWKIGLKMLMGLRIWLNCVSVNGNMLIKYVNKTS